jgi:hypothetical protein
MEKGEFDLLELLGTEKAGPAAIILTQSWCPQWQVMNSYLPEAEKRLTNLKIFYVQYDEVPWHEEFMTFKENTFDNREIPYVRYYKDGKCTAWSNFVPLDGFLHRLSG